MEVITIETKAFDEIIQRLNKIENAIESDPSSEGVSEKWISNKEACKLLMISSRTMQSYRDLGKISYSQIGNKIYYKASDLQDYLERHYIKSFDNED